MPVPTFRGWHFFCPNFFLICLRVAVNRHLRSSFSLFLTAFASLGAILPAARSASAAPEPFRTTFTSTYASQYMFRGQRLSGQSFEPSIELTRGNLGVGVWANIPLEGKMKDSEVDPYVYYAVPLSADLTLVPGVTVYYYPGADIRDGLYRATVEPNVALSWNVHGVKLTPKVYYDVVLDGPTFELSATYALPLKELGTELDFNGQVGDYQWRDTVNSTPKVKAWGRYWLLGVTMPFQISTSSQISLGFAYTRGERASLQPRGLPKSPNELSAGRGVVTLGYSCAF